MYARVEDEDERVPPLWSSSSSSANASFATSTRPLRRWLEG